MSMHYKFEHDFDVDVATYWDIFFSESYNLELYRELNIDRQHAEQNDDGKILRRRLRLAPRKEIPAVFRKVISDMGYTEIDTYDRAKSSMQVIIEPSLMKDRFDMRALYSVQPLGPGRCRRIFEGDVKVSIMLLGGQIEKFMIDEMRTSYETATRVTRRFIEQHKQQSNA